MISFSSLRRNEFRKTIEFDFPLHVEIGGGETASHAFVEPRLGLGEGKGELDRSLGQGEDTAVLAGELEDFHRDEGIENGVPTGS
jgi:hypothetical protein